MKFTDNIIAAAQSGNLQVLKNLLHEMPPMPTTQWIGPLNSPSPGYQLPALNVGLEENAKFIASLINKKPDEAPPNRDAVIGLLIGYMSYGQGPGNTSALLGHLNSAIGGASAGRTLGQWAFENAPYLLAQPLIQNDLYERQVLQMVSQAIESNDVDALRNIIQRHMARQPDQINPALFEQMKGYVPNIGTSWLSGLKDYVPDWMADIFDNVSPAYYLTERAKTHVFSYVADTTVPNDCKRILYPYALEFNALILSPMSKSAKEIADIIYKNKLTDNPVAMRALHIQQLSELFDEKNISGFKKLLENMSDSIDTEVLQSLVARMIIAQDIDANNDASTYIIALLDAKQDLLRQNPQGMGLWRKLAAEGKAEILVRPGVLPRQIDHNTLRELIKINGNKGNVEMLKLLAPFAKQNQIPMHFDDAEIHLEAIEDETKRAEAISIVASLKQIKQPESSFAFWSKQPKVDSDALIADKNQQTRNLGRNKP